MKIVILVTFLCSLLVYDSEGSFKNGNKLVVTDHDLNTAVKFAQDSITRLKRLEQSLADSDIDVEEGTPSHGQLINSYPDTDALEFGRNSMIANKATLYLIQRHCHKYKIPTHECAEISATWSLTSTPMKAKCAGQYGSIKCNTDSKYRSYDGSCNHVFQPTVGQTFTGYKRLLFPNYSDGVMEPRKAASKHALPSARLISNHLFRDIDAPERETTLALVQWTQFIGNDLQHTPVTTMIHTRNAIECCRKNGGNLSPRHLHPSCQQIRIPLEDPDYSPFRATCMNYVRSVSSLNSDCKFGPSNQMNQATHFLDGSTIYGSTATKALSVRALQKGLLAVTKGPNGVFLPVAEEPQDKCQVGNSINICYKSGDRRVNQHPQQVAMYTIWVREHNRIAEALSELNPDWDDDTLYQEARKIVIAEIQHITYQQWLPFIIGEELSLKNHNEFKQDVDPSVSNSFATAAIRFISSMQQSEIGLFNEDRTINNTILLKEHFNQPEVVEQANVMDQLLRGMVSQRSQRMDSSVIKDLTRDLYKGSSPIGLDAVSLDIQRGRDHGLPSYVKFRKYCHLPTSNKFETFADTMPPSAIDKLKSVYNHPEDVDLIVGGLLETPPKNSLLGQTFKCLIKEQMLRTKQGDKYFYEFMDIFTNDQLKEIKKTSLARVLCANSNISHIQLDTFRVSSANNPLIKCTDIPPIDVEAWKRLR